MDFVKSKQKFCFRHIAQLFYKNSGKKLAFLLLYFYDFSCIIISEAIFLENGEIQMKKHHAIKKLITILLTGTLTAFFCTAIPVCADSAPPDAIGSVTIDSTTTFYYDTKTSGGMNAMWNDAVKAETPATVKLYSDWTSKTGTRLISDGEGTIFDGVILVPNGHEITIDLNGHKIDRTLVTGISNGEVLYIQTGGTLNLTDTNASSGHSGSITGGNNLDGAGGIQIEDGGTLNMWGGNISGNVSMSSGGGVLMSGASSKLYMTGGTISGNTANQNGGGIAVVDGTINIVKGEITENTASGSGGGIYIQGGLTEITAGKIERNAAASGGGICTNTNAVLSFKGEASVQENTAGSDVNTGAGAGILAMSTESVLLSGTPDIIRNSLVNGSTSNLTFWIDKNLVYAESRVQNNGVDNTAKIGINFSGGKARSLVFAPAWDGPDCFISDGDDYALKKKDGNLVLERAFHLPVNAMVVWIICGVVVIIAVIAIVSILSAEKKKKKKKKSGKGKSGKSNGKKKKKPSSNKPKKSGE